MSKNTVRKFVVPCTMLSTDAMVAEARQTLEQRNVQYGIILDANQYPRALITREELGALDPSAKITSAMPVVIVEANATLDDLADLAGALKDKPAVLVRENQQIIGVLEKQTLANHIAATPYNTKRGEELAGNPRTPFLYWICPKDGNEYPVIEYRRTDPPHCPLDGTPLVQPR